MKTLLIRSVLIAAVLAPVLSIALHLPIKAMKVDPLPDAATLQAMTREQADAYAQQHMVEMSKMEWLARSLHRPSFWKITLQRSVLPFVVLFVACFGLGYWQSRKRSSQP